MIFCTVVMLGGCYATHEDKPAMPPENLINEDTMVLILADVEIAESALRQRQNRGQETEKVREEYYHTIFANYEVSREQFDESLDYYTKDLETIDRIYEKVISRLSVIESEVQLEE